MLVRDLLAGKTEN